MVDAADGQHAFPRADLREAGGVEDGPGARPHDVVLLHDGRERALPGEVEPQAVLRAVAHQSNALQRLLHFDAIRADGRIDAPILQGIRATDGPLVVAFAHGRVRIDDAEVRIHAEPSDEEDLARAVVRVVVAAVVEVAVARRDMAHRHRRLVDGELVQWCGQHRFSSLLGPIGAGEHGLEAVTVDDDIVEVVGHLLLAEVH